MKKSIIGKLILIIIVFILINTIPTFSNASFLDNIFKNGKDFISTNATITNIIPTDPDDSNSVYVPFEQSQIKDLSSNIYNALLTIAIILAAIILSVLGIQFITGSIEQKVKVKEMLIPFCVGCIVIFGAFGIWKIIVTIASTI